MTSAADGLEKGNSYTIKVKVRMQYIRKFFVLVLIIPLLFTAAGSAAETAKKVAILPFEINAPEYRSGRELYHQCS